MASVKLLVKRHNVSKRDGKTPVYVQYNYSRDKRILINTHRRIELNSGTLKMMFCEGAIPNTTRYIDISKRSNWKLRAL
jgi:hypothetical protein